jgi:RNA polymerase sigma-70 factor (ECF subfamily)
LRDASTTRRFEHAVLAHLDAAYNLARWITRDPVAAEDAVQEACVRALRFFETQDGISAKAWFMTIVRNVCLDWIKAQRREKDHEPYDEEAHGPSAACLPTAESPETMLARSSEAQWVRACIATLPREYREVIVLRELEELSYREIGVIVDVPAGTVMSRLARGRAMLQERLVEAQRRSHS